MSQGEVYYHGVDFGSIYTPSQLEPVQHGVPQGSILGPLLFLLYINDISESSKKLQFFLFADDTTIFFSHKNMSTLKHTIDTEMENVCNWLKANKLSLNVKKSKVLLFRTRNQNFNNSFDIIVNNIVIKESVSAKYLGIYINNTLSFDDHCAHVTNKLVKGNAILSKIRHFVPENILRNVYYARLQPHIDYGLPIWGFSTKKNMLQLKNNNAKR